MKTKDFHFRLPNHVIFLDLPTVCHWNAENNTWSTEDIFDIRHIEDKGYVMFRTPLSGAFGLAVNRYLNFPLQAWELRPEHEYAIDLIVK